VALQKKDCVGCNQVRRVGDKVIFESSYLGRVLATVDAKGGLYVIGAELGDTDE
jgi:hypothetical protein